MTITHLLDVFLKRTYVKEASKIKSFHKLLIYLSKPCCDGELCSKESFSKFSAECARKDFPLKDRLSTVLKSIFFSHEGGAGTWSNHLDEFNNE